MAGNTAPNDALLQCHKGREALREAAAFWRDPTEILKGGAVKSLVYDLGCSMHDSTLTYQPAPARPECHNSHGRKMTLSRSCEAKCRSPSCTIVTPLGKNKRIYATACSPPIVICINIYKIEC